MNIKNKVLEYIDGSLSNEEKEIFEKQLLNDKELSNYYNEVKNNLKYLRNLNEVDFNNDYIDSVTNKIVKNKSHKFKLWNKKSSLAFALSIFIIFFTFLLFDINHNNFVNDDENIASTISGIDSLIPIISIENNEQERTIFNNGFNILGEELNPEIYIDDMTEEEQEDLLNNLIAKNIL